MPSVFNVKLCILLSNANVIEDLGITPYWLESITFTYNKVLSNLEIHGVIDIGLSSMFRFCMGFVFGRGTMFATFQDLGNRCSLYEAFKIVLTGEARLPQKPIWYLIGAAGLRWVEFR